MNTFPTIPPDHSMLRQSLRNYSSSFREASYYQETKQALLETFWPTRCVICDRHGELLCNTCRQALPYIDYWRACPQCGAPHGKIQCSECNTLSLKQLGVSALPFSACTSVVSFTNSSSRLITAYKDRNEQRLSSLLAQTITPMIPLSWQAHFPIVTHIPATQKAFRRRGFDHAEMLACSVAEGLALTHQNLFMRPKSKDQRILSRQSRIENMQGRFKVAGEAPQTVLLIDDVYTTGATLTAASQALRAAGTKRVFCATFARVW